MNNAVRCVQWFNHACPWNQHKHSLAKWAEKRVDQSAPPAVYEGIHGRMRMQLDLSDHFQRGMYLNAHEIVTVQIYRRLLEPGDVHVDAGANIGILTLLAAHEVGPTGRVYAFEPHPVTLEGLRRNVELNQMANVHIVAKGCWHEPGTATLHDFADGHCGEPSIANVYDKTLKSTFEIETTRIDDIVDGPVKLIKIDVEGAEHQALLGAERLFQGPAKPHIIIELNVRTCQSLGYHPLEIVDYLMDRGPYRMHLIKSRRHQPLTRDGLVCAFEAEPRKLRNVWFAPADD